MSEREVSPVTSTPRTLSNMSRTRDSSPGSEGTSTPSDGPGTPRSQRRAALRTTSPHDLTSDGRASPSDPRSNRKALWRIRRKSCCCYLLVYIYNIVVVLLLRGQHVSASLCAYYILLL